MTAHTKAANEILRILGKFREISLPALLVAPANQCCCVQARYDDDEEEDGPAADPQLEGGMPLPIRCSHCSHIVKHGSHVCIRLAAEFPTDLTAIPLEDIDPYYQNKKVN